MKRRAFLKFLGLAPVAAAVPAMALPRADSPLAYGEAIEGVPLFDPRKDVSIEAWSEEIEAATGPHCAVATRIDNLESVVLGSPPPYTITNGVVSLDVAKLDGCNIRVMKGESGNQIRISR